MGLLGVIVASLMAAYRSTVSSHLHLGVAYLINDIYQPSACHRTDLNNIMSAASQVGMVLSDVVAAVS